MRLELQGMEMKNLPEPSITGGQKGQEILPRLGDVWGDSWNSGADEDADQLELEMPRPRNCNCVVRATEKQAKAGADDNIFYKTLDICFISFMCKHEKHSLPFSFVGNILVFLIWAGREQFPQKVHPGNRALLWKAFWHWDFHYFTHIKVSRL